jgi:hypothetical protein
MEFPTTISVSQQQPARYHILFADRQFQDDFLQRVQKLKQEIDYWKSKSITNPDGTVTFADIAPTFDQFYAAMRDVTVETHRVDVSAPG